MNKRLIEIKKRHEQEVGTAAEDTGEHQDRRYLLTLIEELQSLSGTSTLVERLASEADTWSGASYMAGVRSGDGDHAKYDEEMNRAEATFHATLSIISR